MTYEQTAAALVLIATFFPHTFEVADEVMIDLWHRELEPYEGDDVEAAVRDLCRTKEKFPTLKDVLDRLGANTQPTTAWRLACQAAHVVGDRFVGGERLKPKPLPPAVAAAAEVVGGLSAIRHRTNDSEPAMRAHFFRAFEEARVQQATGSDPVLTAGRPAQLADVVKNATMAIGRPLTLQEQAVVKREGGAA